MLDRQQELNRLPFCLGVLVGLPYSVEVIGHPMDRPGRI